MKKLIYSAAVLSMFGMAFISCSDDEKVETDNGMTAKEIADSLDSIKALEAKQYEEGTTVLTYSTQFYASESAYDGAAIAVDFDKLADGLEMSEEDLSAALDDIASSDLKIGYIKPSDLKNPVLAASTTNAEWGYWFNAAGELTEWGGDATSDVTKAMFFIEYDNESKTFNFGQYPARLVAGTTYSCIMYIAYQDSKVAIELNATVATRGEVSGEIVKTYDAAFTTSVYKEHEDAIDFDFASVLSDLGASSMDDITYVAYKADGSYKQEPDEETGVYWMNTSGVACGYADGQFYICSNVTDNKLVLGQYNNKFQYYDADSVKVDYEGTTTVKYGFFYNSKIVMVNVSITVAGFKDTETAPDATGDATIDITLSNAIDGDEGSYDLHDALCKAFGMTTYQFSQALDAKTITIANGESTSYTANNGFWMDKTGAPISWGSKDDAGNETFAWFAEVRVNYSDLTLSLNTGINSNAVAEGDELAATYVISDGTTKVTLNIKTTVAAKAAAPTTEEGTSK